MLKRSIQLLKSSNKLKHIVRTQTQNNSNEKWDLYTAVCLERRPVITEPLNQLQKEYKQLMADMEFELSVKSNFELRHDTDLYECQLTRYFDTALNMYEIKEYIKRLVHFCLHLMDCVNVMFNKYLGKHLEILKKGGELGDMELNLKQTAQDLKDLWAAEASTFKLGDRTTEADKTNDCKSLNRKLDKHLIYVVNQKIGNKNFYLLPQGMRQDGETLRQSAERILTDSIGAEMKVQIYGNAPCGFYKYKYPTNVRNEKGSGGAKVFIYFARYLKGQPPQKDSDYKWLDRNELKQALPPQYNSSVTQFLIDE